MCPKTSQLGSGEKFQGLVFSDSAGDIRNTSLKVSQGSQGIVIDVKSFIRRGTEKDSRTLQIEETLYTIETKIIKMKFVF